MRASRRTSLRAERAVKSERTGEAASHQSSQPPSWQAPSTPPIRLPPFQVQQNNGGKRFGRAFSDASEGEQSRDHRRERLW